ncbi:PREDICTED: DUF724 domain-containing protein 3-like isoform X2 [Camelina sativa]|uniref:DUF724 domain-containing protein 3-like isoform X2 n=1 Tax=Camelina sativa TaxID=90675 RepID=A0ABM0YCQ8_CAMSA|nr:PREDICTED: DUF724 domain-containing protein 3-like isoform X2 [Camelina sativa]
MSQECIFAFPEMEQQTTTTTIMKDCGVEVSPEEKGFEGALTPKVATEHLRNSQNPEDIGMTVTATGDSGKKGADAVMMMSDKTPPVLTSIAKESVSVVTPSLIITATPLKQIEAETERKNQNGLENSSTQQEMPGDSRGKRQKLERNKPENELLGELDAFKVKFAEVRDAFKTFADTTEKVLDEKDCVILLLKHKLESKTNVLAP